MRLVVFLLCCININVARGQQIADTLYRPEIGAPEYPSGEGPVVWIDAGHYNFHTKDGRYWAFAHLLERDGYRVQDFEGSFAREQLNTGKILVISNALNKLNVERWFKPVYSAFTDYEISQVKEWVRDGGSLFLIADHMPLGGAAVDLAEVFGFNFTDGFAIDTTQNGPSIFSLENQRLFQNPISQGRNSSESVDRVATFTGQAFQIPPDAHPILQFDGNFINLLPDTAWVFNEETPIMSAQGWCQGAYKEFGKGKVVAFGEAAMFTAQLAGPQKIKMGMNHPNAGKNYQLLLNIIHWLDD